MRLDPHDPVLHRGSLVDSCRRRSALDGSCPDAGDRLFAGPRSGKIDWIRHPRCPMAKKSSRRSDTDKRKLAEKVEKLRGRLEKAESSTAKWKAEAKRLEVKAATKAKELKKLRKLGRAQPEPAGSCQTSRGR